VKRATKGKEKKTCLGEVRTKKKKASSTANGATERLVKFLIARSSLTLLLSLATRTRI